MARTSRGSSRGNVQRRRTSWELGPGSTGATATNGSGSTVLGAGISPFADGLTLGRLRGEFMAYLDLATAVGDGYIGAFGIGLTTVASFAIGITALETPIDDEAWDGWLYHRYFALRAATIVVGAGADDGESINAVSAGLRIEVDSKAMRKLNEETVVYAAIQVTEQGTATMRSHFNSRTLMFLP